MEEHPSKIAAWHEKFVNCSSIRESHHVFFPPRKFSSFLKRYVAATAAEKNGHK